MKQETIISIITFLIVIGIIIGCTFLVLKGLNHQVEGYEKSCQRMSMNEYEDNCMCPCDKPNWIERKLGLGELCDGWIVNKNESCLEGVEFAR
jgi:hypothetical protein